VDRAKRRRLTETPGQELLREAPLVRGETYDMRARKLAKLIAEAEYLILGGRYQDAVKRLGYENCSKALCEAIAYGRGLIELEEMTDPRIFRDETYEAEGLADLAVYCTGTAARSASMTLPQALKWADTLVDESLGIRTRAGRVYRKAIHVILKKRLK